MSSSLGAVRTCVGCKKKDAKSNLLRFVQGAGELVFDDKQVLPGRGVYFHLDCWEALKAPGGVGKKIAIGKLRVASAKR